MKLNEIVITAALRTAVGSLNRSLKNINAQKIVYNLKIQNRLAFLEEQAQSVADIYAPFIELDEIAIEGDWTRVSGIKKA